MLSIATGSSAVKEEAEAASERVSASGGGGGGGSAGSGSSAGAATKLDRRIDIQPAEDEEGELRATGQLYGNLLRG